MATVKNKNREVSKPSVSSANRSEQMAKKNRDPKVSSVLVKDSDEHIELIVENTSDNESASVRAWGRDQNYGVDFYVYSFQPEAETKAIVKGVEVLIASLQTFVKDAKKLVPNKAK